MIDKLLSAGATVAGVGGYYLATVTDWTLILALGIVLAVIGAVFAFIGARLVGHHAPDLAAMLIQGWRLMLFVMTALAGTVAGLLAKQLFPDPSASAVAFIVAGAVPAVGTVSSGLIEKYSPGWFAYHFLSPYRDRWPSQPGSGKEKGRAAWHRANYLPPTAYSRDAWTLKQTELTLQAFKEAIEANETTG